MSGLVAALLALVAAELCVRFAVRALRRDFQWLVVSGDEAPELDPKLVESYVARSFDPEVGWVRQAGSQGQDQTEAGAICFHIDERGRRRNPGFEGTSEVAVFGDSYAFCRLVEDDETFPHYLSHMLGSDVQNFGVGNYGLDQALLRLERELPRLESRTVVMAFVPETMARVHSYWKHYFEYGNTLAFKPRFVLRDGKLVLEPSAVQNAADFAHYRERLTAIQALDPFFASKFRRDLFRFPYLWRLVARMRRNGPILTHLILGRLTGARAEARRRAFSHVMRENIRSTTELYARPESTELLECLVRQFADRCRAHGRRPILLVIPQPVDLECVVRGSHYYGPFFAAMGEILPTIDLTRDFADSPASERLYRAGPLGPHVSPEGNRLIAGILSKAI